MPPQEIYRDLELQLEVGNPVFSTTGGSSLSGEGMCVARHENFVYFVVGAVPGDLVTAKVFKVKKNYAEARAIRIERPSPLRTDPRCKHFGVCGGCKWQNADYDAQLRFKQQRVIDAFERIGGFSDFKVLPILGSEEIYFYRNKMEFSFSDQQWLIEKPENRSVQVAPASPITNHQSQVFLGLHVPQRYDKILDIEECHLQSTISNEILNQTRSYAREHQLPVYSSETESGYLRFLMVRESKRTNEVMVNIVTYDERPDVMESYAAYMKLMIPQITTIVNTINPRKAQVAYGDKETVCLGPGFIRERIGQFTFNISAASFFQTNTQQAERLYEAARIAAELGPNDLVYDLYSGTGTIAMFISTSAREVVGVESSSSGIKDAERNATQNGVRNCVFLEGDLKDKLTKDTAWLQTHANPDVVITDPPRSGMHAKVCEEIAKLAPSRIVYVSCNPATQARDVKLLCERNYRLMHIQPVDMFPHTYHVENIALLHRD